MKQRYPIRATCFVLVYQIHPNALQNARMKTVAFLDDAAIVIRNPESALEAMNVARSTLFHIRLNVNDGTELIAFARPHLPAPRIITPTTPRQHRIPSGLLLVDIELCHTTTQTTHPEGTIEITSENPTAFQHLGHLIQTHMNPSTALKEMAAEGKKPLANLHSQPLTYPSQIQSINSVIIPKLIYCTKCLPPEPLLLLNIQQMIYSVVLEVTGCCQVHQGTLSILCVKEVWGVLSSPLSALLGP